MTLSTDLAKARKRLKSAQEATSRFMEKYQNHEVPNEDARKYERLLVAEMEAIMRLTDLEIGLKRRKPKTRRSPKK